MFKSVLPLLCLTASMTAACKPIGWSKDVSQGDSDNPLTRIDTAGEDTHMVGGGEPTCGDFDLAQLYSDDNYVADETVCSLPYVTFDHETWDGTNWYVWDPSGPMTFTGQARLYKNVGWGVYFKGAFVMLDGDVGARCNDLTFRVTFDGAEVKEIHIHDITSEDGCQWEINPTTTPITTLEPGTPVPFEITISGVVLPGGMEHLGFTFYYCWEDVKTGYGAGGPHCATQNSFKNYLVITNPH